MPQIYVAAERRIQAPAALVYGCIADYQEHHPQFLPPAFFEVHVEQGGIGAGTVFSFKMTVGGRTRDGRMQVSEPDPGHVLVESGVGSTIVTKFIVEPEGGLCRVRFETTWEGAKGIGGFFERLFAPAALRGIYKDELERLEQHARSHLNPS